MTNSDTAAVELGDRFEAEAFCEMLAAAPADLARRLGLATRRIADATLLLAPGAPDIIFNRVIGLGNQGRVRESELDEVIAVYRDAGVSNWWIHLSPGMHSDLLKECLTARGFVPPPRKTWAKVLRGTAPLAEAEAELEVRRVRPGEEAATAAAITAAFAMPAAWVPWFAALAGRPRWRAYCALDGGVIVGGGMLYIDGDTAWLGAGGMRPEARRHGAHRVLMNLRIADAISSGCTKILTETGEAIGDEPNPSLRNMAACGFTKICSRLNYAAPPPVR